MYLVTHGPFRSRDKDGGHTIRFNIAKNPTPQANFMALCFIIETELLPIEVLHCRNRDFGPFLLLLTLTLTWWPSYTNLTRILSDSDVLDVRIYVKVFESYRITEMHIYIYIYIHTSPKLYTPPLRGWSIKNLQSSLKRVHCQAMHVLPRRADNRQVL